MITSAAFAKSYRYGEESSAVVNLARIDTFSVAESGIPAIDDPVRFQVIGTYATEGRVYLTPFVTKECAYKHLNNLIRRFPFWEVTINDCCVEPA